MLRVLAAVYMCTHTHAGWHKAGPRGGPVSSHVLANIGGLFLPSLRGAWRIGCYRCDYQVGYYYLAGL